MAPPILSKPSKAAQMAIAFVTLGALVMVNTAMFYIYTINHPPADGHNDSSLYWCYSFFFSGMTLFVIGLLLGRIGRSGRKAEMPPETSGVPTGQPAVTSQPMAVNNQAVVPGQPVIPGQPPAAVQPVATVPPVANTAPTARVR